MHEMIEEYRQCASICATTDYGDKKAVRRHNQAVDKMYRIVETAAKQGSAAVSVLIPLLEEPPCAKWLAHQLLEKTETDPETELKCLAIIEALSKGEGPGALGEQYWLRDYRKKKDEHPTTGGTIRR
jgi:hypothetical protein